MPTLLEQRKEAVEAARAIAEGVKAAGRDNLTPEEMAAVNAKLDLVKELDGKIAKARESEDLMSQIEGLGRRSGNSRGFLALSGAGRKAMAGKITERMRGLSEVAGMKALLPSGEVGVGIDIVHTNPIAEGRPAPDLLSVIPVVQHDSPRYTYLRQNNRTNNAAPVAAGDLKPTSSYGLAQVDGQLTVVAHLTEPINKYWLEDNEALGRFVGDELLYGINEALQQQILHGDGAGPNMTGLLNTSGIQVQPAVAGDLLGTLRAGITNVETLGHTPGVYVLNPLDWAKVETTKAAGTGNYLLDTGPVDRAARRLWGVPVALSLGITPGTAVLIDTNAVAVDTDHSGIRVEWAVVADDFARNQLRARCEGRFNLSVYQPAAIVKITLPTG